MIQPAVVEWSASGVNHLDVEELPTDRWETIENIRLIVLPNNIIENGRLTNDRDTRR